MKSLSLLVGVCLAVAAKAQQFQNLDFELGATPVGYNSFNPTPAERQELLPGWITYYRNRDGIEDDLGHSFAFPLLIRGNDRCLGAPCIWVGSSYALHRRYGVGLDAGGNGLGGGETGLRQIVQLPADAKSLRLLTDGDRVIVRVGKVDLPHFVEIGAKTGIQLSVDVSSFAGQMIELTIATKSYATIDYVTFSTSPPTPLTPTLKFTGPLPDGRILLTWDGILQQSGSPDGPFFDIDAAAPGSRYITPFPPFQYQPALFFRARN